MANPNPNLVEHLENYNVENTALHRKLQTNVQAIRILRMELDKYRTERDQFKLMAETIQLRYCAMKSMYSDNPDTDTFLDSSSATKLLNDMRGKNIKLSTELEKTKDRLIQREGDIEVLRQEKVELINRLADHHSLPTLEDAERQSFIFQLESLKRVNAQLKLDLHSMVDDKSEVMVEIEAYKEKARRLQEELVATTRGNLVDSTNEIDKLLSENEQLKHRMRGMEKDLAMSREIILKYKKYVENSRQNSSKDETNQAIEDKKAETT